MHAGEVVFFLIFNLGVIFGLHFLQTRLMAQKLKYLKKETQELEDLVVAIIEELGEAVTVNPDATKPKLKSAVKPEVTTVQQPEKPEVAFVQQPEKSEMTFAQQPELKLGVTSAPNPEVKQELIPPQKPKTKAKPKVKSAANQGSTEIPRDKMITSPVMAKLTPNSAAKLSLPINKVVSDSKRQKVLDLAQQGLEIAAIAKQLKMGQGEIQLILGLYKKS
jgi:hypothetical protein